MILGKTRKGQIIWIIWSLFMALNVIDFLFYNTSIYAYYDLHFLKLGAAVLLSVVHVIWYVGVSRGILFIATSISVGAVAEYVSMTCGTIFGSTYSYVGGYFGPAPGGLPVLIPLYWFVYIYTAYLLTSTLLVRMQRKEPNAEDGNWALLVLLIVFDSLFVLGIDVILDPVMVKAGWWQWDEGGDFYNVPTGNFIGWFIVTFIVSGVFRFIAYIRPGPLPGLAKHTLIPAQLSYGALYLTLAWYAIEMGISFLPVLGLIVMGMPLLFNLFLGIQYRE